MLLITLNVNGLQFSIKRHKVTEWIKKTKQNNVTQLCAAYKKLSLPLDTQKLRGKGQLKQSNDACINQY
jgi:hypothetical protein